MHRPFLTGLLGLLVATCSGALSSVTAAHRSTVEHTVELLTTPGATPAPPISSDEEHADAIAPVLTPKTAILYHDDTAPATDPGEARYVVSRGRIFVLDGAQPRAPDQPMLRIRPVDGGQDIDFVIRSALALHGPSLEDGTLEIVFSAPAIFRPSIEVRSAWVRGRSVDASVLRRVQSGTITVKVPVSSADLHESSGSPRTATVLLEGTLRLRDYNPVAPNRLLSAAVAGDRHFLADLASLSVGRDCRDVDEAEELLRVARSVTAAAPDAYQQILAVNRFVSSTLRYMESAVRRSAGDILEEGVGDCDDHAELMVVLLRALGISCRPIRGFLYDFSALAPHAWVEAALPRTDGDVHWFICDPTLVNRAAGDDERDVAVQLRSRAHLYPAQPLVALSGIPVHHVTDILLNVAVDDGDHMRGPADVERYVREVTAGITRSLESRADAVSGSNLLLRRELPLTPGSSYVIGERTITEGRSALRTVLESDERVAIELVTTVDGVSLGDSAELAVVEDLRACQQHLDWLLFHGLPAHHCLDLTYARDVHTDHLERVRLTFNRYLIQSYLRPITKRLRKEGLWTDQEAALIDSLHRTSGGTNLYFLQELARRRVADSTRTP